MEKIERVEDLPEWFGLDKYRGCENFDVNEWYRQLLERQSLFEACVCLIDPDSTDKGCYDWYEEAIEEFREAPLKLSPSLSDIECKHLPIRSLRAYDLHITASEEMHRQGSKTTHPVDYTILFKDSWQSEIEVLVTGSPYLQPAIVVDLGANDSTLKAAFAAWLSDTRKRSPGFSPSRSKPNWRRWARYGLLPYIDLWIWSMETETHIPDRVMSSAISNYDVGEENLRKTIAPLAIELMSDLSALQSLVALQTAQAISANAESFGE
ncbi:DUF6387 family protein [Pseudomonas sp. MDT2-39-1]